MTPPLPSPATFSRVPPEARLCRGEWSWCAMDRSLLPAVQLDTPAEAFHHIALSLDRTPRRITLTVDGRQSHGRNAPDMLVMIAAGAGGRSWWDASFDAACFYFSDAGLAAATGGDGAVSLGVSAGRHAPDMVPLFHALRRDADAGQPHGRLVGDAIFLAIAGTLLGERGRARLGFATGRGDWRVGRALAYIHAHLSDALSIEDIADAATTSPFHLNALFRAALGCSIWRYVLRERARHAAVLMRDPHLTLTTVAQRSGFDSYAGFIASIRREYGFSPGALRAVL